MRILIIEDKHMTVEYLKKGLAENGFIADIAYNGVDGLHLALTGAYDLIVLDVMLPVKDGWSILQELRTQGKETPVIFLTARDTLPDRIKGLKLGADDYLVKPFAFSELLFRIHSILRRGPVRQAEIFRVADLEIDLPRHRAIRGSI